MKRRWSKRRRGRVEALGVRDWPRNVRVWTARKWHSGSVVNRLVSGPVKLFAEIWPPIILATMLVAGGGWVFWTVAYPVEGWVDSWEQFRSGLFVCWGTIALGFLWDDWCDWTSEILEANGGPGVGGSS
jgi:hypothetical protein